MKKPLVSILIDNFNYARFLGEAIESALGQTYAPIEVVVVDDGSTDASRDVIAGFGDRVIPVLKENGGQASAFNAAVARSRGEILCFLDADDAFEPHKVERIVDAFAAHPDKPLLVCHPMSLFDADGQISPRAFAPRELGVVNLFDHAANYRGVYFAGSPTTGMSLNRALSAKLFPLPEEGIKICADDLVVQAASLVGYIFGIEDVLARYRVHSNNRWYSAPRYRTFEYHARVDRYVNELLGRDGLPPLMDFPHSIYAWHELMMELRGRELLVGVFRGLWTHPDRTAMRLAGNATWCFARRSIRRLLTKLRTCGHWLCLDFKEHT